jgi:peroxiredoxin
MRKLGDLAGQADADLPALRRLAPVAEALKLPAGWRKPVAVKVDAHHPPLDSLGPFRWTPPAAPPLAATDADGLTVTLAGLLADGRPTLVLFHLGHGCPHCLEQLRKFLPAAGDFESRGIRLVAVGRESRDALRRGTEREKPPVGVVMLADEDGAAFRAWRVHDDFEDRPLHGAFLLDGAGRIRWMDTGPDPFLDVKLLLAESSRLLSLPSPSAPPSAAGSAPTGAVRR